MITTGKTAKREVESVKLSRYACYLIVQNADPNKEIVALGQNLFCRTNPFCRKSGKWRNTINYAQKMKKQHLVI